jgi:hypothetical protein
MPCRVGREWRSRPAIHRRHAASTGCMVEHAAGTRRLDARILATGAAHLSITGMISPRRRQGYDSSVVDAIEAALTFSCDGERPGDTHAVFGGRTIHLQFGTGADSGLRILGAKTTRAVVEQGGREARPIGGRKRYRSRSRLPRFASSIFVHSCDFIISARINVQSGTALISAKVCGARCRAATQHSAGAHRCFSARS